MRGFVLPNSEKYQHDIFIDITRDKPFHVLFGHELSHHIEKDQTINNDLWNVISPMVSPEKLTKYRSRYTEGKVWFPL